MTPETFCGGIFETNCYLLKAPEGSILFDAPDGACEWLASRNVDLKLLLLTHGHFDHIPDVAKSNAASIAKSAAIQQPRG